MQIVFNCTYKQTFCKIIGDISSIDVCCNFSFLSLYICKFSIFCVSVHSDFVHLDHSVFVCSVVHKKCAFCYFIIDFHKCLRWNFSLKVWVCTCACWSKYKYIYIRGSRLCSCINCVKSWKAVYSRWVSDLVHFRLSMKLTDWKLYLWKFQK